MSRISAHEADARVSNERKSLYTTTHSSSVVSNDKRGKESKRDATCAAVEVEEIGIEATSDECKSPVLPLDDAP